MREFTILKRDGKRDRFSLDKIMTAIIKAFQSVGQEVDLGSISKIGHSRQHHRGGYPKRGGGGPDERGTLPGGQVFYALPTEAYRGPGNHGAVEIFGRLL